VRQEKFKVSVVGSTTRVEKSYGQSKKNEVRCGKCLGDAENYKHRFEKIEASLVKNEAPLGNFESDALKKANAPARRANGSAKDGKKSDS
jgi:hypothetical protein